MLDPTTGRCSSLLPLLPFLFDDIKECTEYLIDYWENGSQILKDTRTPGYERNKNLKVMGERTAHGWLYFGDAREDNEEPRVHFLYLLAKDQIIADYWPSKNIFTIAHPKMNQATFTSFEQLTSWCERVSENIFDDEIVEIEQQITAEGERFGWFFKDFYIDIDGYRYTTFKLKDDMTGTLAIFSSKTCSLEIISEEIDNAKGFTNFTDLSLWAAPLYLKLGKAPALKPQDKNPWSV